MYQTGGKNK